MKKKSPRYLAGVSITHMHKYNIRNIKILTIRFTILAENTVPYVYECEKKNKQIKVLSINDTRKMKFLILVCDDVVSPN